MDESGYHRYRLNNDTVKDVKIPDLAEQTTNSMWTQ
jgi:hypothetical protein